MKKIIFALFILVSSVFAGTVGGTKDGKLWDTAYLDIYIGEEVNYQYTKYYGEGFNLKSRNINNAFDLYQQKRLNKSKIQISGRIEIPAEAGKEVFVMVKGSPSRGIGTHSSYSNLRSIGYHKLLNQSNERRKEGYGWILFINGQSISKDKTKLKVSSDSLGNKFMTFRIEGLSYHGNFQSNLSRMRDGISNLSFSAEIHGKQTKRGAKVGITKVPLRVYVIEE